MKFTPKNIKKFQQGGPMDPSAQMPQEGMPQEGAPEEAAPQEGQGQGNPLLALAEGAAQAMQSQDCQIALQVCEGLLQLVQQMMGQSQQQAPAGEPVFRRGGILTRRIKK